MHSDNILPSEKCIIVFIMLLRVTMWFSKKGRKKKRSRGEKLNGQRDIADLICRADMSIQMTSDRWSRERQPVGNHCPCVLLFGHIYTFFNDTCHWTDQKHVSSGWKIERKERKTEQIFNGVDTFHCERHNLFYCRTKWYSKST